MCLYKFIVIFISYTFSACSFAFVERLEETDRHVDLLVNQTFVLKRHDTIAIAEKENLQAIKTRALDHVGGWVSSQTVMVDSEITDTSTAASSGRVEIVSLKHTKRISDNGSVELDTTAKVRVSLESIRDGFNLTQKVERLEKNNALLVSQMKKMIVLIEQDANKRELASVQQQLISTLNNQNRAYSKILPEKYLLNLAMEDNDYTLAQKTKIDNELFNRAMGNIRMSIGEIKITRQVPRDIDIEPLYKLKIPLHWTIDKSPLNDYLNSLCSGCIKTIKGYGDAIAIVKGNNEKEQVAFDYIRSKQLLIKIDLGFVKKYRSTRFSDGGKKEMIFYHPIAKRKGNDTYIFQFNEYIGKRQIIGVHNEYVISDLNKSDLELIKEVRLDVILDDAKNEYSFTGVRL